MGTFCCVQQILVGFGATPRRIAGCAQQGCPWLCWLAVLAVQLLQVLGRQLKTTLAGSV